MANRGFVFSRFAKRLLEEFPDVPCVYLETANAEGFTVSESTYQDTCGKPIPFDDLRGIATRRLSEILCPTLAMVDRPVIRAWFSSTVTGIPVIMCYFRMAEAEKAA